MAILLNLVKINSFPACTVKLGMGVSRDTLIRVHINWWFALVV